MLQFSSYRSGFETTRKYLQCINSTNLLYLACGRNTWYLCQILQIYLLYCRYKYLQCAPKTFAGHFNHLKSEKSLSTLRILSFYLSLPPKRCKISQYTRDPGWAQQHLPASTTTETDEMFPTGETMSEWTNMLLGSRGRGRRRRRLGRLMVSLWFQSNLINVKLTVWADRCATILKLILPFFLLPLNTQILGWNIAIYFIRSDPV